MTPSVLLLLLLLVLLAATTVTAKKQLATSGRHVVLIQKDGLVFGLGNDFYGQLGAGKFSHKFVSSPTLMKNVMGATDVCAGAKTTCIVDGKEGKARCTGQGAYNQLGYGRAWKQSGLVSVSGAAAGVDEVVCSEFQTCALLSDLGGAVKCWGYDSYGSLGMGKHGNNPTARFVPAFSKGGARQVALGVGHMCILTLSGELACTGSNWSGQLGLGDYEYRLVPTTVTITTQQPVESVACGYAHTCVVDVQGALLCWGENHHYGQLGEAAAHLHAALSPVLVMPAGSAKAVSLGEFSTLVTMLQGGEVVRAFGRNRFGQLGNGLTNSKNQTVAVDFAVPAGVTVVELHAGSDASCFLDDKHAVRCVGSNAHGQLARAKTTMQLSLKPLSITFPAPGKFSKTPTKRPTKFPTTRYPTSQPTRYPTRYPTSRPTKRPTGFPTKK